MKTPQALPQNTQSSLETSGLPAEGTPVRVEWQDSTTLPGWHYLHVGEVVDATPRVQVSRGVLVGSSSKALTIAGTVSPCSLNKLDATEGMMDLLIIPVGCVMSVQVIP